eukprot:767893-Hanusia_phi.AAC.3
MEFNPEAKIASKPRSYPTSLSLLTPCCDSSGHTARPRATSPRGGPRASRRASAHPCSELDSRGSGSSCARSDGEVVRPKADSRLSPTQHHCPPPIPTNPPPVPLPFVPSLLPPCTPSPPPPPHSPTPPSSCHCLPAPAPAT